MQNSVNYNVQENAFTSEIMNPQKNSNIPGTECSLAAASTAASAATGLPTMSCGMQEQNVLAHVQNELAVENMDVSSNAPDQGQGLGIGGGGVGTMSLAVNSVDVSGGNMVEGTAHQEEQEVADSTKVALMDTKSPIRFEHGKHPLQHKWTFWYLENDCSKSWEEMLNEIISFDTVEDFWSIYNHIKPPSEILLGSDYSLFKTGIRPMWEDENNKLGGRWVIPVAKFPRHDFDQMWMDTLLCLIGEVFDSSDQVCGAVANVRGKNSKISIWTTDGYNSPAVLEIGCKLKEILGLGHKLIQYQLHKDTMCKATSGVHALYTI